MPAGHVPCRLALFPPIVRGVVVHCHLAFIELSLDLEPPPPIAIFRSEVILDMKMRPLKKEETYYCLVKLG